MSRKRSTRVLTVAKSMKLAKGIYITAFGVQFPYFCDAVMWIYPWHRISGNPYISFGFDGVFPSLAAIAYEWGGYDEAMRRTSPNQIREG